MSETLAEQILSAMPRIRCACGEQVGFRIVRDPSSLAWGFVARHLDRTMVRELGDYSLYGAGCSRVSVIHTGVGILRKMAERLMEDCQHAAWNSNAPYAPTPTAEIEFRDGHTEQMAIRSSYRVFGAEPYGTIPLAQMPGYQDAIRELCLSRTPVTSPATKSATFPAPRSILR